MDENNKYGFIIDYAIGNYDWVIDLSGPSEFSWEYANYEFNSNDDSLDLTIPYF